jgi:hypothetical protein
MYTHADQADQGRRRGTVRSLVNHLEQHMRLQRELFWPPRLGVRRAQPVKVRVHADLRRSWTPR